jgi:LysR family transcriptional regulator, glycine cleavage system transcriptional activator
MTPASSRRLLPSMTSLMIFEAAARTGSFGKAASRVALTQSAVSRGIAALEQSLGVELFHREGRRVRLTDAGRSYAEHVGVALDQIRRATSNLMSTPGASTSLSVATLPGFGMRWLAPRLPRFFAEHPELSVSFLARLAPFDFNSEALDAAIHFGDADWPGATADFLMRESMITVCAPQIAGRLRTPDDLTDHTLLEQSTRPHAWREWFVKAGVRVAPKRSRPKFEHFMMVAQAAAAGAGVALVPSFLVETELAQGTLVQPFNISLDSQQAYYLVYPHSRLANSSFLLFRKWLLHETASHSAITSARA